MSEAQSPERRNTIAEAIVDVMRRTRRPMTAAEAYEGIVARGLYVFNAEDPVHMVRGTLRRQSLNLAFATGRNPKLFKLTPDGRYDLLPRPIHVKGAGATASSDESSLDKIKVLHEKYVNDFRQRLLARLKSVDPAQFERFARRVLLQYGFRDVVVTGRSRDGGVDGHGLMHFGLAELNTAFQCKRWKGTVGRPDVNQFRGDIQGRFDHGVFITTATFSPDAKSASFQSGAVPIILVDGPRLVDLLIEKGLGVERGALPIYTYALDPVLAELEDEV